MNYALPFGTRQEEESTTMLSSHSRESDSSEFSGEGDLEDDFLEGSRKLGMNWSGSTGRTIGRRHILSVLIGLIGLSMLFTFLVHTFRPELTRTNGKIGGDLKKINTSTSNLNVHESEKWVPFDKMLALNFPTPQSTLASQLKPGVRYLTGMGFGGHSNQFIAMLKLIYLAKVTNRVAIIPSLLPLHFLGSPQDFSDFFDLGRLYHLSKIPAVEFSSFKPFDPTYASPQNEKISCWSIQLSTQGNANLAAASMDAHGIWIDFWALPPHLPRALGGHDLAHDGLRIFDFDAEMRRNWVETIRREFLPQKILPPDSDFVKLEENIQPGFDPLHTEPPNDSLVCYDNTLFTGPIMFPEAYTPSSSPLEPYTPGEGLSWMEVGQYVFFNEKVESVVDQYLMKLFDVNEVADVPVFISIHLRRGDFKEFTGLTSLEKFQSGLQRVQELLQIRLGNDDWRGPGKSHFRRHYDNHGKMIEAKDYKIVVTTDEPAGTEFMSQIKELGWKVIDHQAMETEGRHGPWYPTILDAAILARGQGFVGTPFSTFSHLSALRVKYWNGGITDLA